ncbi:MAG TPA: translation initiation factor IF-2 [Vicinamibacteria bacterium]|nr:translation initiation factor IF-2 [Vicinamibacteria bacterium]
MDKVRVYELARELEMTSPETIELLKSKLKIRVKSASSTIEEDTATKLKRMLRLEKSGARRREKLPATLAAEDDTQARAKAARHRRAEKARQALLAEMEAEERARQQAKKEQEELKRREKEREEEAARAAQAEKERIAAEEADRVAAELAREAEAEPETVEAVAEVEAPPPQPVVVETNELGAAANAPAAVEVEEKEVRAESVSPPTAPPEPRPPAREEPPAAAPPSTPPSPKAFVPGPTSQYIRPRPAPPPRSRREEMKPVPAPPRPAAPIKTVRARGAEAKPKRKQKRGPQRSAAVEVAEHALPEPAPRIEERRIEVPEIHRSVTLTEGVTVKELAEKLEVKHKDVIKVLLGRGVLATINQTLDAETATEVAKSFGAEAEILSFEEDVLREESVEEKPEDLASRAPVVTVMGHVDHGKTSLLDAIRQTKVVEKEAGGITQHVGAYSVDVNGRGIVFLDTPGHEAFTLMRARGAGVTDLVVLVVAADDGVMPQTREAIDHARAANVPILVAINKVDKANANPDRVKQQLAELDLSPEDWGGSTVYCEVSAKKRQGLDLLLEMILLVSDLLELKANPSRAGMGTVLEAKLDKGKGPVAHVLVQNGTITVGDPFVAGAAYGKVRAMFDDRGHKVKSVGPAAPVEILGLTSLPQAGEQFQVFADTAKARQISEFRQQKLRERELASSARLTLDALHQKVKEGSVKELPIVLKADVQGSVEVLEDTLTKLSTDQVKVRIIRAGAGAITDTDVILASASNAVIIGFNVRPERTASELAEKEAIDIRLHTVIYNVTDELNKAIEGLLEPTFKEVVLGRAEVRELFKVPRVGTVSGCYVIEGRIARSADARLLRDNVVVFEGKLGSLRRFKDDVSEVKEGFECGIGLAGYNDVKVGDVIEAFAMEKA